MEEFLAKLREKAVYFKLESKPKYGGGVGVEDVISVLKSLSDSYLAFVDIEYSRINIQQDRKKLNEIKRGIVEENTLIIVDLSFSSFASAVAPNFITNLHTIPSIKNQRKWKKETFERYKSIVLESDFNNKDYLNNISRKFSPTQRQRIFAPIIEGIIKNPAATTRFGFGSSKDLKPLTPPKDDSYSVLVPKQEKQEIVQDIRTSLAMVEIKGKTARPKVLELFGELKNPIYTFTSFSVGDREYKLRFPIYCELIHEGDTYSFENKEIGIYAYGKTIDEAQQSFYEDFDYIFTRYNSLPNGKLTDDVIRIKKFLNLIVS